MLVPESDVSPPAPGTPERREDGVTGGSHSASAPLPWMWIGVAVLVVLVGGIVLALVGRDGTPPGQEQGGATARRAEPYRFSNIAWGTPPNEVAAQLASKGFRFSEQDEEGDHVFQGHQDGRVAVVIAMLARNVLAKTIVVLVADGQAERLYADVNRRLAAQYGPPAPATAGATRRPVTRWPPQSDATGETRLWTTITDEGDVAIHYESSLWAAEARRRRSATSARTPPAAPVRMGRRVA
jgi:hypothetical protein